MKNISESILSDIENSLGFIPDNYFDKEGFLGKVDSCDYPFYNKFFKTQAWTNFLYERFFHPNIDALIRVIVFEENTILKKNKNIKKKIIGVKEAPFLNSKNINKFVMEDRENIVIKDSDKFKIKNTLKRMIMEKINPNGDKLPRQTFPNLDETVLQKLKNETPDYFIFESKKKYLEIVDIWLRDSNIQKVYNETVHSFLLPRSKDYEANKFQYYVYKLYYQCFFNNFSCLCKEERWTAFREFINQVGKNIKDDAFLRKMLYYTIIFHGDIRMVQTLIQIKKPESNYLLYCEIRQKMIENEIFNVYNFSHLKLFSMKNKTLNFDLICQCSKCNQMYNLDAEICNMDDSSKKAGKVIEDYFKITCKKCKKMINCTITADQYSNPIPLFCPLACYNKFLEYTTLSPFELYNSNKALYFNILAYFYCFRLNCDFYCAYKYKKKYNVENLRRRRAESYSVNRRLVLEEKFKWKFNIFEELFESEIAPKTHKKKMSNSILSLSLTQFVNHADNYSEFESIIRNSLKSQKINRNEWSKTEITPAYNRKK